MGPEQRPIPGRHEPQVPPREGKTGRSYGPVDLQERRSREVCSVLLQTLRFSRFNYALTEYLHVLKLIGSGCIAYLCVTYLPDRYVEVSERGGRPSATLAAGGPRPSCFGPP